MMLALLSVVGLFQDPIAAVRADEARRVEVVARCAPAVCSVMAMDAPGGGSGVVFDPRGYVLTNFHVVGEPDEGYRPSEPPLPPVDTAVTMTSFEVMPSRQVAPETKNHPREPVTPRVKA